MLIRNIIQQHNYGVGSVSTEPYRKIKEGELLNHLTVNCAITASSPILVFQNINIST